MLSVKQGGNMYHFLSLWYDLIESWSPGQLTNSLPSRPIMIIMIDICFVSKILDLFVIHNYFCFLNIFRLYSLNRIRNTERYYDELPDHHRTIIPNFRDHLSKVRNCIETNFHLIKLIIQNTEHMFENKNHGPVENVSVCWI